LIVREANGEVEQIEHGAIGTRLGEGLREGGDLAPAAMERTLAAAAEFAERARAHGAGISAIATSAMRRAANAHEFAARFAELTGTELRVLDGPEEAVASFRGAMEGAPYDGERRAVLDVGGGSTECAAGCDGVLERARSVEIGSVSITERFPDLAGHAPGAPARAAALRARATIASELAWLADFKPVREVRCVAGTPLTLGAVLYERSADAVSGRPLPLAALDATIDRLLDLPLAERRVLPGMLAQRADILPGGGLIVSEALRLLDRSEGRLEANDLLLGYLLERAER
jgi:exopolyphosphatase/guanosine-5'-triphosphate,3'-diphosphate pyrophosphatase